MKKNNVKWIFNDHSIERFFDRTTLNITKKDIAKAITNNQIVPFKRVNVTRSMCYIHVKKEVIKTIMHRKKNKIITILPWQSVYQFKIKLHIQELNNRKFKIYLFPDCYLETGKPNALTKVYEKILYLNSGTKGYEQINYDHYLFNKIVNIAWSNFVAISIDHNNIQKERRNGNETFAIKGKTETIEFGINHAAKAV